MPDRLFEHPATVFVLTNMYYAEAPWLTPASPCRGGRHDLARGRAAGASSGEFETQIAELGPFLEQNWRANISPKSGMPIYERPVALVLYREDHRFLLDLDHPRRGPDRGQFRPRDRFAALSGEIFCEFPRQADHCTAWPGLAGRRAFDWNSLPRAGSGPEIIQAVWPGENPFAVSRHELLRAVKYELGSAGRDLNFNAYADNRSIFRYDMEALPNEVTGSIGTSTAFAAWNAAVYVAQIEDDRLTEMTENGRTLDATREVLRKHNGLWFYDESYVISRRRD